MSKVVYKYEVDKYFTLNLPAGWKPVMVAEQRELPFMWVEFDKDDKELWQHYFQVFATGEELPELCSHLGSWQRGAFVWHLYQIGSVKL